MYIYIVLFVHAGKRMFNKANPKIMILYFCDRCSVNEIIQFKRCLFLSDSSLSTHAVSTVDHGFNLL